MTEPLAYLNGNFIAASQLTVPVWDAGFVQGVTIAEQLRTFRGVLFRFNQHLERLFDSLRRVEIALPQSAAELQSVAERLINNNLPLLEQGDELGLSLFVTPGPYRAFAPAEAQGPTLGMHTYPVAFGGFAEKYDHGERLIISSTRQIPNSCWPASLKCRSRMHYYLADREARAVDADARALLLDQAGFISEASTANFLIYRRDTGFLSPPREKILPGVSVNVLAELARTHNEPFHFRDLAVDGDLWSAEEAFLCSTSPCLLPVISIDSRPVGDGKPGPTFRRMMDAWSQAVGVDIVAQAKRFAKRN
jgi:branched-chain amino acid aminotransferase